MKSFARRTERSTCPSEWSLTVRACSTFWPKTQACLEDRGTALTVPSLRERRSAGVGRDQTRSALMWVPTRVQLADGLIKLYVGVFLRHSDIWKRSAPRGEYESLEEETTYQQFERGSGRLSGANGS